MESWNVKLLTAVKDGDIKVVTYCLDNAAKVNCTDSKYAATPLHWAAKMGFTEIAGQLITYGANINIRTKGLQTPLHWAAKNGRTETAGLLIIHGCHVNLRDKQKWTPLHLAAHNGDTETADLLITHGSDINLQTEYGNTAYDVATNDNIKELLKTAKDLNTIGVPSELIQLGRTAVSIFTDLLKEESYELFELRSMLQGEQGTGKSTIARFLVGKGPSKARRSTDGIELYTGLSFFDNDTEKWSGGKKGFKMEDITVSRCVKSFKLQKTEMSKTVGTHLMLAKDIHQSAREEIVEMPEPVGIQTILPQYVHQSKREDMLEISESVQPMLPKDMHDENLKRQSPPSRECILRKVEVEESLVPEDKPLRKKVDVPQLKQRMKHQLIEKELPSNIDKVDDNELHKPNDNINYEIIQNPGLIEKLKVFFGVNKAVKEVKISVTEKKLFKKLRDIAKKKFHNRNIVPVTIWDFGGQDVFYSTHQTFLTYRAVYMLVLDGSRTMNEHCKHEQFLPGKTSVKTQKDYVRFWINTIITYCKVDIPGFPKIMIILTHKDKLSVTEIDARRNEVFSEIERMFDGNPIKQHLFIKDKIFVNALDSKDPEMEQIKKSLIHLARIQPTWGQKLPKCFLPLELELQYLVKEGYTLIHIEQMKKINFQQPVRSLTDTELKLFLKFQHSVGKILYFDEPYLDQHIIISPTYLIDAFKSIITDYQFCVGDKKKEEAWHSMAKTGIILKQTVETIWKQKKYSHFLKSMAYLLGVMTRLDILVEPLRYDSTHNRKPNEFYYVASMIRKQDTTGYLLSPTFSQRNIALCFDTSSSVIPPALSFRFLSYCLSIWDVKTYGDYNEDMLFHRSAVFTIDPSLDLHIQCEDEQLIVRLVHKRNRTLIMKDLASSIRECLLAALHKISQLYIKASGERTENRQSFDVKVCCSSSMEPCSIAIEDIGDVWICSRHQIEHGKDLVLSWFTEKGKVMCESFCPVTDEQFLLQSPTDLHLRRLALEYDTDEIRKLVIQLKLPFSIWKKLHDSRLTEETTGFEALQKCFQMTPFTFKDLTIAAEKQGIQNPHTICKILRDRHISFDSDPEKWDLTTTDEDIDKLAPVVGGSSLAFLVELGLTFHDWEKIQYSQTERDLVKLNRKIMEAWRINCTKHKVKPTLRTIGGAFGNIGKNIKIIENVLFI